VGPWLDRTNWWGAPGAAATPQRMLVELLEAIAGRFVGKELTVEVQGKRLSLTLGAVKVETTDPTPQTSGLDPFEWWKDLPGSREMRRWTSAMTGMPVAEDAVPKIERVVIDSRSVRIDERPVGEVVATVDTLRLEYGRATELVTGSVDLDVHTRRQTVLEWVERDQPKWNLRLYTDDLVAVDRSNWPFTALVRPTILEGVQVRLDIVGVVLFGRTFMLPDHVHIHLRHAGLRQPIHPEHIRNAVREGVSRLTAAAFA
jgi:hypothetical protein